MRREEQGNRSRGSGAPGSVRGGPLYPACPAPQGERPFPANSVQRRGRGEAPSGGAHRPTKLFQNHPCVTQGWARRGPIRRCGAIFGANGRVGEAGASWSSGSAGRSAEESGAERRRLRGVGARRFPSPLLTPPAPAAPSLPARSPSCRGPLGGQAHGSSEARWRRGAQLGLRWRRRRRRRRRRWRRRRWRRGVRGLRRGGDSGR